ncbi:MAG TPA: sugar-binding protein [Actinotalea sp.]|nr:sugar-binding protein [Actinotalea sp.]
MSLGTLTLVEELSFTEVVQAPTAPTVDGVVDDVWELAAAVSTDTQIEGSAAGAAPAEGRTLWSGDGTTLYVLAEVTDDQIDLGASNPWEQDSVEIFLDAGNGRNGPSRYDDTQIRTNGDNVVSFGTGDETSQANRLTSATSRTETGYLVEAAISLLESGGPGSFHGFDVQVNDGTSGARTSVRTWADPTGLGYQNTSRWGVAQLVEPDDVFVPDPKLALSSWWVRQGDRIRVDVSGYYPGEPVTVTLRSWPILWHHKPKPVLLGSVPADAQGSASAWLEVPRGTRIGLATITATQGELSAKDVVVVVPKHLRWPGPWRPC